MGETSQGPVQLNTSLSFEKCVLKDDYKAEEINVTVIVSFTKLIIDTKHLNFKKRRVSLIEKFKHVNDLITNNFHIGEFRYNGHKWEFRSWWCHYHQ